MSAGGLWNRESLLQAYVAMRVSTGIRPGLEAKTHPHRRRFEEQDGKPVILISVMPRAGKHPKAREVIVFEGSQEFHVRRLVRELIDWRKSILSSNKLGRMPNEQQVRGTDAVSR